MHCTSSRCTGPSPCSCSDRTPSNLIVAASSNEAATASPQRVANARRVFAVLDQRTPGGIQVHQVAANRILLEQEAMQAIAVMHLIPPPSLALSSSLSCAGFALPPVAFITWPTKKPNNLSLPDAVVGQLLRIGGDHGVDDALDGARIGDLLQALAPR